MGIIGLSEWFTNFSQISFKPETRQDLKLSLATIPNPYLEYGIWSAFKIMQISSVVGGMMVHPAYRYYLMKQLKPETMTNNSYKVIRTRCRKIQGRFLLAGLAISPLVAGTSILINGYTRKALENRCYEIRCDLDGLIFDRTTFVFGWIGWYWKRFQGAVDFINFSVIYSTIYVKWLRDSSNILLKDRVKPEEKYKSVLDAAKDEKEILKFLKSAEKN
uniref:Uncharacterized protein n=1 Tax=Ditylenchus dipsaci TaxID=166011 RepID=A0A915CWX5_9BILA